MLWKERGSNVVRRMCSSRPFPLQVEDPQCLFEVRAWEERRVGDSFQEKLIRSPDVSLWVPKESVK